MPYPAPRRNSMEVELTFAVGFAVWIAIGILAGYGVARSYKAAGTEPLLTFVFGVCGAFIGGFLGESAHVFHDANPLRIGGLIGAVTGSIFFAFLYHLVARKVV
jgi:uncharacterized membrane protein YeaQ/YmgE (transglycosylase-associated protein family)